MKIFSPLVLLSFIMILTSFYSCKKEEYFTPVCDGLTTPTYDADIKVIIDANCGGAFCHNSGSKRGDFTNYADLEPFLINGTFKNRVLTVQDMPKGKGKTLTQDQINKIQCWVDNGYPEN